MFDLAGLAVAHARHVAGGAERRQYDIEIPFGAQFGDAHDVQLWRDGELLHTWTLEDASCVAPEPVRGGAVAGRVPPLGRRDVRTADDAEAAIVLRRACDIGLGRGTDLDGFRAPSSSASQGAASATRSRTRQHAVAFRQIGTIRDFDGRADDLLAEGPHP